MKIHSLKKLPTQLMATYMRHRIKSELLLTPVVEGASLPSPQAGQKYVLYIHIPFCQSLCPYCSFNRYLFKEDLARDYFKNLREEIRMIADLGFHFESAYIGGGTPTIQLDELTNTIDLVRSLFNITGVSCETNPNHLNETVISELEGRVDRLSVGIQSFNNDLLKKMNRYEKYGSGEENLERLKAFNNRLPTLNADMIFNLPMQTEEILLEDVEKLIESGVNQCTFYPLMASPSVKESLKALGNFSQDRESQFYDIVDKKLGTVFHPVSAWTYSRQGLALIDEYIAQYEEYVGVGPGSFGYLNGQLFMNTFSINKYIQKIQNKQLPLETSRKFGKMDQMQYRFMMSLFDHRLDKQKFKDDFGVPVEIGLLKEITFMRLLGAFTPNSNQILELNLESRYLLVVMMSEFFSGVNTLRDQARRALPPNERHLIEINC